MAGAIVTRGLHDSGFGGPGSTGGVGGCVGGQKGAESGGLRKRIKRNTGGPTLIG